MTPLLLDTCALLWWLEEALPEAVAAQLLEVGLEGALYVSAVSIWEIGLLARRGRIDLRPDQDAWLARVRASPVLRETPLTADRALASSFLPGDLHADPADRMLAATARDMDAVLVTRDARLLAYAEAGHMQALAC